MLKPKGVKLDLPHVSFLFAVLEGKGLLGKNIITTTQHLIFSIKLVPLSTTKWRRVIHAQVLSSVNILVYYKHLRTAPRVHGRPYALCPSLLQVLFAEVLVTSVIYVNDQLWSKMSAQICAAGVLFFFQILSNINLSSTVFLVKVSSANMARCPGIIKCYYGIQFYVNNPELLINASIRILSV